MSWSVLAGAGAGAGHDRAAISSQDAHLVAEVDGTLVAAVADGASSAPLAATGASLAVGLAHQEIGRLLRGVDLDPAAMPRLVRDGARRTLGRFRRAVAALARGSGRHPRDFATTLTVVLARPPWVGTFAVGDGFVVTRTGSDDFGLLLDPPGGADRTPGATMLLPQRFSTALVRRRVARIDGLTGLAVGTDGLETLVIDFAGARPVRPAKEPFTRLFSLADDPDVDPSALSRILAGRRVGELSSDDRTLVLAVFR